MSTNTAPENLPRDLNSRVDELLEIYGSPHASVAHLLCDRHAAVDLAYTVVEEGGQRRQLTYGQLRSESEKLSASMSALGLRPGDRVATLMGKSVEQLITPLAIWRLGAVHVPLFTAFASDAIAQRLSASDAIAVICDVDQYPKLQVDSGPSTRLASRVIVSGGEISPDVLCLEKLIDSAYSGFPAATLGGSAAMIQIYTSGTTGGAKGVIVPTRAMAGFHAYMEMGLGLEPGEVFWNAADPGWAYGLYLGVLGSLCTGTHSVLAKGGFSVERTWKVLSDCEVTSFTAGPTVYRSLRSADVPVPGGLKLRRLSAAGEPLTPDINEWASAELGLEVHNHYGQTETGMVACNHHHPALRQPIKGGAMGQAMPGWRVAVLDERDDEVAANQLGRFAVDLAASPLAWFSGYVDEPERTAERFTADGRWYLTGDVGRMDEDGYLHFLSRDDDVILMAGYRISPTDIESVLRRHPGVVDAAVVAAPDEIRGEILEAFIVLGDQAEPSVQLTEQLRQLVRENYARHAYPRRIHFVSELPKTPSGKIQRFKLRERRISP